jgi:hypothetical protein
MVLVSAAAAEVGSRRVSHLVTGRLDARFRLRERFGRDRHVKRIGVEEIARARHDADMALPEDEVAAAKRRARA